MELTNIAVSDTAEVMLTYPGGDPIMSTTTGEQCSITLYGPGSKVADELNRKVEQKSTNLFFKQRTNGGIKVDVRERKVENTNLLTDLTVSLNGFTYKGGNDKESIKAMYSDIAYGFIRAQVDEKAGDWANFLQVPNE